MDKFKKLDQLIEQAIREDLAIRIIEPNLKKAPKANYGQYEDDIRSLASNDEDASTISVDDIMAAYSKPDEDELAAANYLDNGLSRNTPAGKEFHNVANKARTDAAAASMKTGASKIKAADKPQAIFQFDLANAGMQEGTPTMSPALKNVFDTIGLEDETLYGRIRKINAFTAKLEMAAQKKGKDTTGNAWAAQQLREMGLVRFTRYVLVLDYINTIVKNMDAGAGAYLFETFLAALAGGNVAGKETTGKGQMGGADFTFGNNPNARGSAKYLKSTSKASQSPKGFEQVEFIHYVIARKILDSTGKAKKSSVDVDQIVALAIYYPVLAVIEPQKRFQFFKVTRSNKVEKDGSPFDQPLDKQIMLPSTQENLLGTLSLVTTNTDKYRELVERAVVTIGGKFEEAFDSFKGAFDSVAKAKETVGVYSTSGKASDGDKAIDAMLAYKAALAGVFEKLAGLDSEEDGYEAGVDTSKLAENKENKFIALDKLIEAVILEEQKKGNQ